MGNISKVYLSVIKKEGDYYLLYNFEIYIQHQQQSVPVSCGYILKINSVYLMDRSFLVGIILLNFLSWIKHLEKY